MINQKQKVVKTRKEHMCLYCGKTIPIGSDALHVHSFVAREEDVRHGGREDYYCVACIRGENEDA